MRAVAASTLLCERCGYVIEGLDTTAACPECGRAVACSLPAARPGSAWQRGPSPASWIRTAYESLRRPNQLFESIRIETRRARALLVVNLEMAAYLLSLRPAWWMTEQTVMAGVDGSWHPLAAWAFQATVAAVVAFALALGLAMVLAGLTWIEWAGIQFFGRLRGRRITPPVATAICAHASVGWVIAAGLTAAGLLTGGLLVDWLMNRNLGPARPIVLLAPVWLPLVGFLAGLMVFETLTYLGVLRCRFVNLPRPDSPTGDGA